MSKLIAVTVGTRPEVIKLAPLVRALQASQDLRVLLISTAQQRDFLAQALADFGLRADVDLDVMLPQQSLWESLGRALERLGDAYRDQSPDLVVVQGDTTTALAGALAAHYQKIPVAHVEAGLRSFDMLRPHPEEANRCLVTRLASLHFAPTEGAAANLRSEAVAEQAIFVTGNTVIDALEAVRARASGDRADTAPALELASAIEARGRRFVLVTAHRRESLSGGLQQIAAALCELRDREPEVEVVVCLHKNPAVSDVFEAQLRGRERLHLIDAQPYPVFLELLARSALVLTDSGGIQEEAPFFGKPVVVLREVTEREEAVDTGHACLAGFDAVRIVELARAALSNSAPIPTVRLFGDGRASERIVCHVRAFLGLSASPIESRG